MNTLISILTAIIAWAFIVIVFFWLGVGLISLINWIIFRIVEWFDSRRK